MERIDGKIEIRDLRNGDWYWIHKAVIQKYTPKIGAIGITVYNFLASLANSDQSCFPSQKYIAKRLGYSRATINKTIRVLEGNGLIKIEKRSRYHCIYHLLKIGCKEDFTSKSRCKLDETQMSTTANSDVKYIDTNDNKITRINNNIDNDSKNSFKDFKPQTREELLAKDIAIVLNDYHALPLYLSYSKKYPESLLRKILGEVREIPQSKIKKSRGALFNHIIKKYAEETNHNSGN